MLYLLIEFCFCEYDVTVEYSYCGELELLLDPIRALQNSEFLFSFKGIQQKLS
jgi:hypothetical protein